MQKPAQFLKLLIAQFLSQSGDFALEIVFFLITLELSNNDYFIIGVVYFFKFIPYLIFGPIGGWLSDQFNKKYIMIIADLIRFFIVFSFFILYVTNLLNYLLLIIIACLHTIGRTFFQPCFQSIIPQIVNRDRLVKANSYSQISSELATIIGPLLCSMILLFSDKKSVILLDSFTFILSAIFLGTINYYPHKARESKIAYREGEKEIDKESEIRAKKAKRINFRNIMTETKDNIISLFQNNKEVITVILFSALSIFFVSALLRFLLPAFIISIYNDESMIGYAMSTLAVGTILGGIIYSRISGNFSSANNVLLAWLIYGLLFSTLIFTDNIISLLIICLLIGISGAFVDIGIVTNIQRESQPENLGKNFGLFSTFANTAEAGSGIIGGIFALISLTFSFFIMSILVSLISLAGILYLKK